MGDRPKHADPTCTEPLEDRQEDLLPLLEVESIAQGIYLAEHRRSTRERWHEEPYEVRVAYRRRATRTLQARIYGYDPSCRLTAPNAEE